MVSGGQPCSMASRDGGDAEQRGRENAKGKALLSHARAL
jgi:hypothetical protein